MACGTGSHTHTQTFFCQTTTFGPRSEPQHAILHSLMLSACI